MLVAVSVSNIAATRNCFPAERHTRYAACKHTEATYSAAESGSLSPSPQQPNVGRSVPNISETSFSSRLSHRQSTCNSTPYIQIIERRFTPAPARVPASTSIRIPSYIDEVQQSQRKAKLTDHAVSVTSSIVRPRGRMPLLSLFYLKWLFPQV